MSSVKTRKQSRTLQLGPRGCFPVLTNRFPSTFHRLFKMITFSLLTVLRFVLAAMSSVICSNAFTRCARCRLAEQTRLRFTCSRGGGSLRPQRAGSHWDFLMRGERFNCLLRSRGEEAPRRPRFIASSSPNMGVVAPTSIKLALLCRNLRQSAFGHKRTIVEPDTLDGTSWLQVELFAREHQLNQNKELEPRRMQKRKRLNSFWK